MSTRHLITLTLTVAAMGAAVGVALGLVLVAVHRRIGGPPPTP